ncbi:hypothetical protein V6N13_132736 [Hibiscus sabdariffa]
MQTPENGSTHFPHSLLLEIMPFDYAKWAGLFTGENQHDGVVGQFGSDRDGERCELGGEDQRTKKKKKKKKRRGKKKRLDSKSEEENGEERCCFTDDDKKKKEESGRGGVRVLGSSRLLSACTRLHQRVVQRRGRSSNSLRSSNIYKLEMEQKRLEENAFVYNWLQQQLKLSPAYKKAIPWKLFVQTDKALSSFHAMFSAEFQPSASSQLQLLRSKHQLIPSLKSFHIASVYSSQATDASSQDLQVVSQSQGAISAPMYSVKGPSMVKSQYPAASPLKHLQKDLRLALGLAESVPQSTPITAVANELYKVAKSYGLSDEDFSAVIEALKAKSHNA